MKVDVCCGGCAGGSGILFRVSWFCLIHLFFPSCSVILVPSLSASCLYSPLPLLLFTDLATCSPSIHLFCSSPFPPFFAQLAPERHHTETRGFISKVAVEKRKFSMTISHHKSNPIECWAFIQVRTKRVVLSDIVFASFC